MSTIQECLQVIYHSTRKGIVVTIPLAFEEEYQKHASERYSTMGNSARASNKKSFIRGNLERIYPLEYETLREFVSSLYQQGFGLKLIGKELDLGYSQVRTLFRLLGVEINKGRSVCYEKTRELRSENLKQLYKERKGWFVNLERKTNSTTRGIQGYYYSTSSNGYVWLRSTYEYIYAKWLDKQGIEWHLEEETFQLEGTTYRPDFFIYENGVLVKIVEIKGYWARGAVKTKELNELLKIDVVLVKDIKPYLERSYAKELKLWKQERISEQELKR